MKKILLFSTVALIAAVSCNKENETPVVSSKVSYVAYVDGADTKTSIGLDNGTTATVYWSGDEEISIIGEKNIGLLEKLLGSPVKACVCCWLTSLSSRHLHERFIYNGNTGVKSPTSYTRKVRTPSPRARAGLCCGEAPLRPYASPVINGGIHEQSAPKPPEMSRKKSQGKGLSSKTVKMRISGGPEQESVHKNSLKRGESTSRALICPRNPPKTWRREEVAPLGLNPPGMTQGDSLE